MSLPIFTKEHAYAANRSYFRKLRQTEPGIQYVVLGKPKPALTQNLSYAVVRRTHRKKQTDIYWQGRDKLHVQHYYPRHWYVLGRYDYLVATIAWEDGFVRELAAFATQNEATKYIANLSIADSP